MFGGGNTNALCRAMVEDEAKALAMIKPGRWLDRVSPLDNETPLMTAARLGALPIVEALLAAGADPNRRGDTTALHLSAGNADIAAALIEAGADLDAASTGQNGTGSTPLMMAVMSNALPVVKLLIEAGADMLATNDRGETALTLAQSFGKKRMIAYLEKAVATSAPPPTSLFDAVQIKSLPDLERLLAAGERVDARDAGGGTALHSAAELGWAEGAAALLAAGAGPNDKNADGLTPLMGLAKGKEGAAVATALIDAGADTNVMTENGWTPLMRADSLPVVRALLDAGADPRPAFAFACVMRERDILEAMLDAGAVIDEEALRLAKTNRPARLLLAERLGEGVGAADRLREGLKSLAKSGQGDAFKAFAAALGDSLGRDPSPWKRRKGALYVHDVSRERIAARLGEAVATGEEALMAQLGRLASQVRASGYTLFATGVSADEVVTSRRLPLVLLPTSEALAAPLLCGTNANMGGDTTEVVDQLHEIAAEDPFDVVACGHDYLQGRLHAPSKDPEHLATRLLALCPDLADTRNADGTIADEATEIEALAAKIQSSGLFMLWWD